MGSPVLHTVKLALLVREISSLRPHALEQDAVHVWWTHRTQAESRLTELQRTLAGDEIERAQRFRFDRDRNQYIISRGLLRELLGRYLQEAPEKLQFRYSDKGKPELLPASSSSLRFNLSHSGNLTMLGFAWNRRVGVDVEFMNRNIEAEEISARFFSASERQVLRSLRPEQRVPAFFACWTRKEAYVKATGDGLSLPLDQFDVSLAPGEEARLLSTRPDAREAKSWQMWNVDLDSQYAAAVIVEDRVTSSDPSYRRPDQA
jgi:4'-phosphopantetheinyl transferase